MFLSRFQIETLLQSEAFMKFDADEKPTFQYLPCITVGESAAFRELSNT
jgi:hypothetical protein